VLAKFMIACEQRGGLPKISQDDHVICYKKEILP
jgi:hypothetical protein